MNWGTKIVLGMIVFMLFIIAMVVYMFSVHGNDALVDEDYYEKGINYDHEYNAKQNVARDGAEPKIVIIQRQLMIKLKDSADYGLSLKRPSTSKDDMIVKGTTVSDSNLILIDTKNMHSGLWFLELKWMSNGKAYFFKKDIIL